VNQEQMGREHSQGESRINGQYSQGESRING